MLHEPRLLLMDEPATGLDVKSTESLIGLIEQEKQRGAIVIIVTHEAKFGDAVADRVEARIRELVAGDAMLSRLADAMLATHAVLLREFQGLDKAALHFCLADAFHPGCELTWPMRHASLYSAPFRIRPGQGAVCRSASADFLRPFVWVHPGGRRFPRCRSCLGSRSRT